MEHPAFSLSGLARKGSLPSLIAGVTFSAIYAGAGYLLKNNMEYGVQTALGASTLMFIAGINRGIVSRYKKPVPIVLTILGAASTLYYTKKYEEFYL
ncbi:hypothetical protein LJB42_004870 [Komagataella kurtzmanii]|nr:hypothetical protein LJB42_004870 [Komagataella kurtzmanii]